MKLEFIKPSVRIPNDVDRDNTVICKHCGSGDTIVGYYTTRVDGSCDIRKRDGELQEINYESYGDEYDFVITNYRCIDCEAESEDLEDLLLPDDEDYIEGNT